MRLCSEVIMYTIIQPLPGSAAHTSIMYTTVNIHIWSMRLCSHVIMYTIIQPLVVKSCDNVQDYTATPRGNRAYKYHVIVFNSEYPYMVNAVV